MVNDKSRGRARAGSHTAPQSVVNLAKGRRARGVEEGGVYLVPTGKLPPLKAAKKSAAE